MKIIKKEFELIGFESLNKEIYQAMRITKLEKNICENGITYWIHFETAASKINFARITLKTYNELLEYLGWGKE